MTATATLRFTDLSQSRVCTVDLGGELTVEHDVDHAIDHFLDQVGIPRDDLEFSAYSRGVRLDKRSRLADLPDADTDWMVLPTVSAGAG
jgi:hypothetical protein